MADNQVLIQIRGDVADINAKLADLKGYIGKVSSETQNMSKISKNSWALVQTGIMAVIQNVQLLYEKMSYPIEAFKESESVAMKLAVAMRNQGDYTREAFEELERYAKVIQDTTRYEDDHVISLMANLKTYGMTNEEIKRATATILDFVTAKRAEGMSVEAAGELIGKAYIGNTERLKRYGIVVDQSLDRAAKFNAAMTQLNERFGGAAQADLETYAGRVARFKNQMQDVAEFIGQVLLKSLEAVQFGFSMLSVGFWTMLENFMKALGWFSGKVAGAARFFGMEGTAKNAQELADYFNTAGKEYENIKDHALKMADANYKAMVSFDSVDKAVSKMKAGKRFIPFEGVDKEAQNAREAWAAALREMEAEINKLDLEPLEQKLIDITKKAEDLRVKAAKLPTEAERKAAEEQIGRIPKVTKDEKTGKWKYEDWTSWVKAVGESVISEQAKKDFEDWLKTQQDIEKYTKDQASRLKAIREGEINEQLAELDIAEKLGMAHRNTLEERIRLEEERLKIQEQFLQSIDREKDPAGWNAQKSAIDNVRKSLAELYRELLMRDPLGAIKLSMKDLENEWTDTGKQMYNLARETAQSMQSAFSDFFFDAMDLKLKSLADYVRSFLTGVQRAIAQSLGQQLTGGFISGLENIGGLFGISPGSVYHQGGTVGGPASFYRLVPAAALADIIPRRHAGGLAPDERLVINKVGERYVTAEQNSWLTGIARAMSTRGNEAGVVNNHITINAVDAKSFEELCRRNPQAVISPVMQSMRDNRTRKEMKSLLK